jgi:hypothetical protein
MSGSPGEYAIAGVTYVRPHLRGFSSVSTKSLRETRHAVLRRTCDAWGPFRARGGCGLLRPRHRLLVDGELVAQGQVLQGDMAVSTAEEGKQSKQAEQEGDHRAEIFSGSAPPE